jgi:alginate O-acetyltransferase complex protein AlgI
MLFHSPTFLIFLSLYLVGLHFFKSESRIVYSCICSYIFYGWWYPPYTPVLLGLTLYAHYFAKLAFLTRLSIWPVAIFGVLPLVFYKYTGFILENIEAFTGITFAFEHNWDLPLGISFITFTAIAYIIDTRRGDADVEPSIWRTALFISFFPQLIAGPILRAKELIPQLARLEFDSAAIKPALLLFAIGALKKVGVADQLGPVVDQVYSGDMQIDSVMSILVFYAFSIQIYCDFSGYTDMALALGILLKVNLPLNFNSPYSATSIRDFWRRWHMTLSRWLRDYLYIPLGGSKSGFAQMIFAAMATMLLGGLWHGAAWTFIVWGGLHGLFVVTEHFLDNKIVLTNIPSWIRTLVVVHIVGATWIFFRAPTFSRAWDVIIGFTIPGDIAMLSSAPLAPILIIAAFLLHRLDNVDQIRTIAIKTRGSIILPLSLMLILICAALSVNNPSAFIYFDF